MDIKEAGLREVRRRRLQDKIRTETASPTRPEGNVSAFGAKYGIGQSRLSRYATAGEGMQVKQIGWDAARNLERDCKMADGELDSLDGEYGAVYQAAIESMMVAALPPQAAAPAAMVGGDIPAAIAELAKQVRPERRNAVAALIQGILGQPHNPAFVDLLREELVRQ
ncbi:MAG: hypothetical protein RLZZ373_3270 [Pseudomonadota bacterium]